MGLRGLTLFLKQGDFPTPFAPAIPSLVFQIIERDLLPTSDLLLFLKWFTRLPDFAAAAMDHPQLRSFILQQLQQPPSPRCRCLAYKVLANVVRSDDAHVRHLSDYFPGLIAEFHRLRDDLDSDDDAVSIVAAMLPVFAALPRCRRIVSPVIVRDIAAILLDLMSSEFLVARAVAAQDDATDCQDITVVAIFYNQRFFDRYFELCCHPSAAVRLHVYSILNHFTQLEFCELQRFLLPAFSDLEFRTHDAELAVLLEICYNLIVKDEQTAAGLVRTNVFRVLSQDVLRLPIACKEIWILALSAIWTLRYQDCIDEIIQFVPLFVETGISMFGAIDETAKRMLLEGFVSLKQFCLVNSGCAVNSTVREMIEEEEFVAALTELVDDPTSKERVRALAQDLLPDADQ
jgi:hypothetical protein